MTDPAPTAAALIIGDEILSGRTQDANVQFFGQRCAALGIQFRECRIVPDIPEAIIAALNALRAAYTYVFTTGGIGPTHDDITTDCVAAAFGRGVIQHPEAAKTVAAYYGEKTNAARLRMANVPEGPDVSLIANHRSVAPGYRIGNVFVLAGVPSVARAMFAAIEPLLQKGPPVHSRSVDAFVREGDIAAALENIQRRYPQVSVGSYPYMRDGQLGASIVARGTDRNAVIAAIDAVAGAMRDLGAEPVFPSES